MLETRGKRGGKSRLTCLPGVGRLEGEGRVLLPFDISQRGFVKGGE